MIDGFLLEEQEFLWTTPPILVTRDSPRGSVDPAGEQLRSMLCIIQIQQG